MPNFVDDMTDLPPPKTDVIPLGVKPSTKWMSGEDYNMLRQAAIDLRGAVQKPVGYVSAKTYGALGTADDLATMKAAVAGAQALNARLFVPPDTAVTIGQDGANPWGLLFDSSVQGLEVFGVPGRSVIKAKAGTAAQVSTIMVNGGARVKFYGLIIDGNWGNAVTTIVDASHNTALPQATIHVENTDEIPSSGSMKVVIAAGNTQTITYTGKVGGTDPQLTGCSGGAGTLKEGAALAILDANTGINHPTQADPRNDGIFIRAGADVTVDWCVIKGTYGDGIRCGFRGDPVENVNLPARRVRIYNTIITTTARHGISVAQSSDDLVVRDTSIRYNYGIAFDCEPQTNNQFARNILFDHCYLGLWFNPGRADLTQNFSASVKGGNTTGLLDANAARNVRFVNGCVIEGSLSFSAAQSCSVRDCIFVNDWDHGSSGGVSYAPVFIDHVVNHIDITNNDFYDRGKFTDGYAEAGDPHGGVIVVQNYGDLQPANVRISGNRIRARNGRKGIKISSTGGFAGASGSMQAASLHTASAISATSISAGPDPGWPVNSKVGWVVYRGGAVGLVESNTSNVLTISTRLGGGTGWNRPFGGRGSSEATPALGTFTLSPIAGMTIVERNDIDCSNDGNGQGSYGIAYHADRSGMRCRIVGNNTRDAAIAGIYIDCSNLTKNPYLEVADNTADDVQPVVTCDSVVKFKNGTQGIDKLILRNNQKLGGVRRTYAGLTSGYWMEEDGILPRWVGWGSPEGVVRSPGGSKYRRLDGGAGTFEYTKEANGSGVDISAGAGSSAVSVASGGTISGVLPTVTTTVDACLVVLALAAQPGSGTGDFDTWTNANLTNLVELHNSTVAGCIGVAAGVKATAGATGASTARNNGAATVFGPAGITIALRPEQPGVAPVYVDKGVTQSRTTNGTITVAWPVGTVQEGDYALLVVEQLEPDTVSLSTPAGFTELAAGSPQTGAFSSAGSKIRVYEFRANNPSMTSPVITFTVGGSPSHVQATIFTFRGVSLGNAVGWVAK